MILPRIIAPPTCVILWGSAPNPEVFKAFENTGKAKEKSQLLPWLFRLFTSNIPSQVVLPQSSSPLFWGSVLYNERQRISSNYWDGHFFVRLNAQQAFVRLNAHLFFFAYAFTLTSSTSAWIMLKYFFVLDISERRNYIMLKVRNL